RWDDTSRRAQSRRPGGCPPSPDPDLEISSRRALRAVVRRLRELEAEPLLDALQACGECGAIGGAEVDDGIAGATAIFDRLEVAEVLAGLALDPDERAREEAFCRFDVAGVRSMRDAHRLEDAKRHAGCGAMQPGAALQARRLAGRDGERDLVAVHAVHL